MKNNPHWIEFIGLPGSGKTTISSLLVESLKKGNHNKHILSFKKAEELSLKFLLEKSSKIFYILNIIPYKLRIKIYKYIFKRKNLKKHFERNFTSENNELIKLVYSFIDNSNNKHKGLALKWFHELISTYQLIQSNLNEDFVILVDEGFLNRSLSIFCYKNDEFKDKELLNYLELIPAPAFLFNIGISLDESIRRLKARGYPIRMRNLNEFDIQKILKFLSLKIPIITNFIECRRTSVFYLNNDKEKTNTISQLNEASKTISISLKNGK